MRIKLFIVAIIIVASVLMGTCYGNYQYHKSVVAKNQETIQQANAAVTKSSQIIDRMVTKYNALWEQCQKGVSAYNLLSTASKVPANMPNCGLSLLR